MSDSATTCPDCGAVVVADPGWRPWCDGCGWNATAVPAVAARAGVTQRLYASAGRRLGDRTTTDLASAQSLEPRWTASKVLAVTVAAGVHVLTVAFAVLAVLLVLATPSNPLAFIPAVILGGLAWLMRPRSGRLPDDGIVARDSAPELHRLVDEVAAAAGARRADVVVIDAEFNASWGTVGLRRRRVLTLGLPLWSSLAPDARVALLAHEFGHDRNGDAGRLFVVGTACEGLEQLFDVLSVRSEDTTSDTGLEPVVEAIGWLVSRPVLALLAIEAHLMLHDAQRAEYLADDIAARVAGTGAAVALLEQLLGAHALDAVVMRHSREHLRPTGAVFDELREAAAAVPPRERERRRRAARSEDARLDATHPPHGRRIGMLEARPQRPATVTVDRDRMDRIERELEPFRDRLAVDLIDRHRSALLVT